jgi:hypothetical protein
LVDNEVSEIKTFLLISWRLVRLRKKFNQGPDHNSKMGEVAVNKVTLKLSFCSVDKKMKKLGKVCTQKTWTRGIEENNGKMHKNFQSKILVNYYFLVS